MIIQEQISDSLILTYSDRNVYIHGGEPEGNYASATDPIDAHRTYTETDIPIESDTDAEELLAIILGGAE